MRPIRDQTPRVIGYDKNNVRRVFGVGPSVEIAETEAQKAADDYILGRPDTGPATEWTFKRG